MDWWGVRTQAEYGFPGDGLPVPHLPSVSQETPMPKKPKTYKYVYRSAVTGKMVSKAFAEANPDTTVRQKVQLRNRGE